ncbi:MAG: winged helix-turn-helix domain-containing protein [Marinicella sp.]
MIFKFGDFTLNDEQKTLQYNDKEVALTKKSYQLLCFLLKNPNSPVTREQLIEHVWENRVVTENTIDQCISKLRKALNTAQPGEYIKSIYGHGIQFTVPVKTQSDENKTQWVLTGGIVLVMVILLLVYFIIQTPATETSTITEENATTLDKNSQSTQVKLSILPLENAIIDSEENNEWFIKGSSQYLTALFANNLNINRISPKPEWLNNENKKLLAVDIISENQADVVALSDFRFDGKNYHADITLRNVQGVMAEKHFQTSQINELMTTVLLWIEAELELQDTVKRTTEFNDFSDDEYALESYIRALSAQAIGDSKKAITYLQAATEQDQNFNLAWYELSVAYRKQGNYRKALAILNNLTQASELLTFRIALTKGHTYDGIKQFDEAIQAYDEAFAAATKLEDNIKIASVLISQAISTINLQQFEISQQKLDQALEFINLETDPHMFGTLMNTYAKLEKARNQTNKAIEYVEKSIQAFTISGDKRYEMQARTRLASLLLRVGKFKEAEELSLAAMAYAKQQKQLRSISSNHFKLAFIYQQTGRFQAAEAQWQEALKINIELNIPEERASIYEYLVDLQITKGDLDSAENYLIRLNELRDNDSSETINEMATRTALVLALANKDKDKATLLISEFPQTDTSVFLAMSQGDLSLLNNNQTQAITHYQNALSQLQNSGENTMIVKVMNRLTTIYLETDLQQAEFNINQTEQFNPFIYPHMKHKATLLNKQGRLFQALTLLEEVKLKSGDFWRSEDQLLLEAYQNALQE